MTEYTTTTTTETPETLYTCADCGRQFTLDDLTKINGDLYCDYCTTTCHECGEVIRYADAVEDCRGDYYCETCVDECLVWCERCEEYERTDDAREVRVSYWRTEYWCEDCCDRYAIRCADCGDYVADAETHYIRGLGDICPRCFENNCYCYCEECDDYVSGDDYDYDEDCCCSCSRDSRKLKKYNYKPDPIFYGDDLLSRFIGVELEVDRDDHDHDQEELLDDLSCLDSSLYFKEDGSLNHGFEIVAHPHTVSALHAMRWADILAACVRAGYTSHDAKTCGLHLHFSREWFGINGDEQASSIAKLLRFFDLYYNDLKKYARRGDAEAQRWAAPHGTDSDADALEIASGERWRDRYHAVNLTNRATVEIRITRGTLKLSTLLASFDLLTTLVHNASAISWEEIDQPTKWLDGCKPDTLQYLKDRGAFVEVI